MPPPPSSTCLYGFYWPSVNPIVDAAIMVVILLNIVLTLVELAVDGETVQLSLQIINYFFVAFYVGETLMKVSVCMHCAHTALDHTFITACYA